LKNKEKTLYYSHGVFIHFPPFIFKDTGYPRVFFAWNLWIKVYNILKFLDINYIIMEHTEQPNMNYEGSKKWYNTYCPSWRWVTWPAMRKKKKWGWDY